jgi:ABC-type dipeptide/oligopeptide/nickel transport system permease subunit
MSGASAQTGSPAAWRRLRRNHLAWLGMAVAVVLVLCGLLAPWLAPYSPRDQNLDAVEQRPSLAHPMGTDGLGRDILSRMIYGARTSLAVLVLVMSINLSIGLAAGAAAAYFGGLVDTLVMRTVDVLFAFPGMLFALFVSATLKQGVLEWMRQNGLVEAARSGMVDYAVVLGALALIGWGGLARLVRGQMLALREADFVVAARAIGVSDRRIILRHLLPNALSPVIVAVSLGMGGIILSEATLSFLGLGIQPPNASWGTIIVETYGYWRNKPYLMFGPGLTLGAVVLGFNWLGDAINDALNPHLGG